VRAILSFLHHSAVFEPEAIAIMATAYDRALKFFPELPPDNVREVIAACIIQLAGKGERDPDKLYVESLAALKRRPTIGSRPRLVR